VLQDWTLPETECWAVFPGRRLMPARTRLFLDALAAQFSAPECHAVNQKLRDEKEKARPRTARAQSSSAQ